MLNILDGIKIVYPEPNKELKIEGIHGWEYPLLTLVYPGFDCGSRGLPLIGFLVCVCVWMLESTLPIWIEIRSWRTASNESQSETPGMKLVYPEPCKRNKRAA